MPNQLKRLTEEITTKNLNGVHNNQIIMVSSPQAGHGKTHLISKAIRNASAENRILEIKITELEDFNYTMEQSERGYENFTVVKCKIKSIEWLYLAAKGHRRAIFDIENKNQNWLVP